MAVIILTYKYLYIKCNTIHAHVYDSVYVERSTRKRTRSDPSLDTHCD